MKSNPSYSNLLQGSLFGSRSFLADR